MIPYWEAAALIAGAAFGAVLAMWFAGWTERRELKAQYGDRIRRLEEQNYALSAQVNLLVSQLRMAGMTFTGAASVTSTGTTTINQAGGTNILGHDMSENKIVGHDAIETHIGK